MQDLTFPSLVVYLQTSKFNLQVFTYPDFQLRFFIELCREPFFPKLYHKQNLSIKRWNSKFLKFDSSLGAVLVLVLFWFWGGYFFFCVYVFGFGGFFGLFLLVLYGFLCGVFLGGLHWGFYYCFLVLFGWVFCCCCFFVLEVF